MIGTPKFPPHLRHEGGRRAMRVMKKGRRDFSRRP